MTTALVSGAGVAGPVTAYWLRRSGLRPTVVERESALRSGTGGHAVDLFGPAVEVVERMGLLDAVQAARTQTETLSFVRPGGRTIDVDVSALLAGVSDRHVEILRGDLVGLLHAATRDDVEYVFGDAVTGLAAAGNGLEVRFAAGATRRFDLVVGADGLHSGVRRLVFGPVPEHFLGGYLAVGTVGSAPGRVGRMLAWAEADRSLGVYGVDGGARARAVFLFRSRERLEVGHRDRSRQRQVLRAAFGGLGEEVPGLLDDLDSADDFWFDAISQIRMPTWSRGPVALVGDAGWCPGQAVGGGTSLAVVGGYALASELGAAGGDPAAGFAAYERAMAEPVRRSRTVGPAVLRAMVPRSAAQARALPHVLRALARLPRPLQRRLTSDAGGLATMLEAVVLGDPPAQPGRPSSHT
jgi:2-polyprenyl-6-methoxyphenol hydroxylase-like FAD-dependent oxidoreductase